MAPRRRRRRPRRPPVRRPVRFRRPPVRPQRRPRPRPPVPAPAPPAALPVAAAQPAPNTTCDIYHGAGGGAADVANVAIHLTARFQAGGEASEGDGTFRWTHLAFMAPTVDVRDNYPAAPNTVLKVPSGGATVFDIVFVELVNRGLATAYKRVFLDRQEPTWPTDQL